jgi:hypothetical protein
MSDSYVKMNVLFNSLFLSALSHGQGNIITTIITNQSASILVGDYCYYIKKMHSEYNVKIKKYYVTNPQSSFSICYGCFAHEQ